MMDSQNKNTPTQNTNSIKHYWLYVLQLEQGKYYVGITTKTPEIRMQQHINGFAAAKWTRRYKPLNLHDKKELGNVTKAAAEEYENKIVRVYIKKYGFNNVRGGDLSYSYDFVKRFGRYVGVGDWQTMTVIILLLSITLALVLNAL